jgi:hypothetical protein
MEFLHMPKEFNGLSDRCVVTLVPNMEEFPCMCRREDRVVKEAWEERGPGKWRCDLAQGLSTL